MDRFVHELLRKRLSSSPAALASTLARHAETLEGRTDRNGRPDRLDERILRRAIAKTEEDYADDAEREAAEAEATEEASRRAAPALDGRAAPARRAPKPSPERRAPARRQGQGNPRLAEDAPPTRRGSGATPRVILFTEYRTTQQWMQQILASHGFGGERLMLIYGGMDPKEREAVKAAFQASPAESPVRILLATDAASEGIDLQNHCHYLIHLEIPYNPNVMEQRNGRIDRHGQKASEVVIWHPVDAEGGHGDDILRALRKLEVHAFRHGEREPGHRAPAAGSCSKADVGSSTPGPPRRECAARQRS